MRRRLEPCSRDNAPQRVVRFDADRRWRNAEGYVSCGSVVDVCTSVGSIQRYYGYFIHSRGDHGLRVRDLRRDFDDATADFFGVALDCGAGRPESMVFRERGALRDQHTVDGGLTGLDFDAVWTARTSRNPNGSVVEIASPWQTLRYRPGAEPRNINFHRVNRRLNESSGWCRGRV